MYLAEAAAALAVLATPAHHPPPSVTVHPGDTLSGLALEHCGTAGAWRSLAAASGIATPDRIYPGRRVVLACTGGTRAAYAGRHRTVTLRAGEYLTELAQRYCGNPGDYPGLAGASGITDPDRVPAGRRITIACTTTGPRPPAPAYAGRHRRAGRAAAVTAVGPARASFRDEGDFERCVIARESGGDTQVMNSSGHYGLYQFSEQTWIAYGGSAAAFGHASAAYQRQVFLNAMARPGGASNWSPYDGCPA